MVHRKSTYKLAFKNLSKDVRKSIWEENSILRERRRTTELSHHSIEECDDSCDCDSVHSDEAEQDEQELDEHSEEEDCSDSDTHTDEDPNKTKNQHINGCCKYKKSVSSKEPVKSISPLHKDIAKINYKNYEDRTRVRKKKVSQKRMLSPHRDNLYEDRKYVSEADLNNLFRSLSTKRKRGVMKCSRVTGELDLIPARRQPLKKEGKDALPAKSQSARQSPSCDKNVINIRPRTAIKSMSRPSSSLGRPQTSVERVTYSDDDILGRGTKVELRSSRREPRVGLSSREGGGSLSEGMHSLCQRCGQSIKHRGILT